VEGETAPVHELSLAVEVASIAERRVPPGDVPRIVAVGVEVGDQSGVEADNLEFCLQAILQSPPFRCAIPKILRVPGSVLRVSHVEVDDDCPHD
jgi:Zn finger protein HypA/HybF involved in hydrogenase expression